MPSAFISLVYSLGFLIEVKASRSRTKNTNRWKYKNYVYNKLVRLDLSILSEEVSSLVVDNNKNME